MTEAHDPFDWLAANLETFAVVFDMGGLLAGVIEEFGDDYRYVSANGAVANHFHTTQAGMIGKTGRDLGSNEVNIAARRKELTSCQQVGTQRAEFWHVMDGQRRRYLSLQAKAPPAPDGAARMAFITVDITARTLAQREAARQQALVEAALDASDMGIWEYDVAADSLSWDARSAAMIGLEAHDMTLETFLSMVHPDDVDRVIAAQDDGETGKNNGHYRVEHRMITADGRFRWIESTGRVSFDSAGVAVRAIGTVRDISAEIASRERQAFLAAELNHRVKNNLAAVQAIANQTLQWTPDPVEFREAFEARVSALGRAHDLLNANAWQAADLHELLERSLEAAAGTVRFEGPDTPVLVLPERAMTLAIIFNELATNAAKHGAHSVPGGLVILKWWIQGDHVEIRWTEQGGPAVKPPKRQGFGSRILRAGVGGRDGAARLDYAPDGLKVRLSLARSPAVTFEVQPAVTA